MTSTAVARLPGKANFWSVFPFSLSFRFIGAIVLTAGLVPPGTSNSGGGPAELRPTCRKNHHLLTCVSALFLRLSWAILCAAAGYEHTENTPQTSREARKNLAPQAKTHPNTQQTRAKREKFGRRRRPKFSVLAHSLTSSAGWQGFGAWRKGGAKRVRGAAGGGVSRGAIVVRAVHA